VATRTFKRLEAFEKYEIRVNTTRDEVPPEYIKAANWKEASPEGRGWFADYIHSDGKRGVIRIHFDQSLKCWTEVEIKSNGEYWAQREDLELEISDQEANPERWNTPREPERAETPESHRERALTGGSLKSNPEEITILETTEPDPLVEAIGQMTTDEQPRSRMAIAAISTRTDADTTGANMADTGNTEATTTAYAGTRSRGAGTGGSGDPDNPGSTSAKNETTKQRGPGRLFGAEPNIFYGD